MSSTIIPGTEKYIWGIECWFTDHMDGDEPISTEYMQAVVEMHKRDITTKLGLNGLQN